LGSFKRIFPRGKPSDYKLFESKRIRNTLVSNFLNLSVEQRDAVLSQDLSEWNRRTPNWGVRVDGTEAVSLSKGTASATVPATARSPHEPVKRSQSSSNSKGKSVPARYPLSEKRAPGTIKGLRKTATLPSKLSLTLDATSTALR
jgi:hypothetical protein